MYKYFKYLHNSMYVKFETLYLLISYFINFRRLKKLPPLIEETSSYLKYYSINKFQRIYFIQIGAYDGISNDPIYHCVEYFDWHGVIIEPIFEHFTKLIATYSDQNEKLALINTAIGKYDGFSDIYTIKKKDSNLPEWCYQISSLDYNVISSHIKFEPTIEKLIIKEQVQIITINTLLKNLNYPNVDVLIIDTEGHDYEILKSIDWAILKPDIIIFEFIHMGLNKFSSLLKQISLLDYQCFITTENCMCLNKATLKVNKKVQKKPFYYKSKLKIT